MPESPELEILHATIERVWSEHDDAKRLAAIGDLYHPDAQIFEPARAVTGHQAISDVVKGVLADMPPGFSFKVLPGGHGHHGIATAQWTGGAGNQVIGSLYQYFPNKAALAAAVIDRCCEQFIVALDRALEGRPRITLAECIGAIVDVVLASHQLAPDLHKVVIDLAPRIGVADRTDAMSRKMAEAIEAVLRVHAEEIAPDIDLSIAATIIEALLVALSHRAAMAGIGPGEGEAIAAEATNMITRYLATAAI